MTSMVFARAKTLISRLFFSKSIIWVFLAIILIFGFISIPSIMPNLIGGLGLFLFGMVVMSEGLQAIAGAKMRKILTKLAGNRFSGVLTGFSVTAIMQSSSATSVMLVGFVNAKLMSLRQAIGVIFGANIGTTITAYIVALNITKYYGPIIGIAVFMIVFSNRSMVKNSGNALLGFGLLFLGMSLMKESVGCLQQTNFFPSLISQFQDTPILALLAGMLITMIIQSSSATEGLIASMALAGAFGTDLQTTLNAAIPLLLGSNIGTTITAQIAAITTSRTAKRVAWVHTLFNVIGAGIFFIILPLYIDVIKSGIGIASNIFTDSELNVALYLAGAHMMFNIVNCLIFLPFVSALERITRLIIKDESIDDSKTKKFTGSISESNPLPMLKLKAADKSIIHPSAEFYVEPAKNAIHRMLQYAKEGLNVTRNLVKKFDEEEFKRTEHIEDVLDNCQILLNSYIEKAIIGHEKSLSFPIHVGLLHHAVNDIEKIGDISYSLAKRMMATSKFSMKISDEEEEQIQKMFTKVLDMLDFVLSVIQNGDIEENKAIAKQAYELEYRINAQLREFRMQLRQRPITEGYGWYIANISDIYSDLENIGDNLKNVLEAFGFPEKTEDDELN
ncbi:MAG: Na/Pi cotransporter family protein [Planctomycetes bacterium]|nr:Na/Pi cotransporter family protein [Planctomycetota bacterium]